MIKKLAGILLFTGISFVALSQTTEIKTTETKKRSSARPDIPGTFTLELGVNRTLDAPGDFDLGFWGARSVNIYYQYDLRILKSRFSLVPGIGLSLERFKFSNNYTLGYPSGTTNSVELLSPTESAIPGLKKSQLITNYIDVPVELRYSSKPDDPARSFKISIGGRIGFMYDAFTKVKYKESGEMKKYKDKQDYNVNKLRYGALAKIGIGNFALFGYYNLSPLFEEGKGLYENSEAKDFTTFTVGISLSSF